MEGFGQWVVEYWVEVLFGIVCTVGAWSFRSISKKLKMQNLREEAMREAALALLDHSMGKLFQSCLEKEYATREEARRYERMYCAYHNLGGNGAVTNEHNQFIEIPVMVAEKK